MAWDTRRYKYMNVYTKLKENCKIEIVYKGNKWYTIIDFDEYEKVKSYSWCIWIKKNKKQKKTHYYVACKDNSKTRYLHQIINGKAKKGFVIDHINRNTLDNRKINLRQATRKENLLNSDKYDIQSKLKRINKLPCNARR